MRALPLRESPVPVLAALLLLLGFVMYLHWSVVARENSPTLVRVPRQAPLEDESEDPAGEGPEGVVAEVESRNEAGPLHSEARALAASGRLSEALARLDDSLAAEGRPDAERLRERAVLALRLGLPEQAIENLKRASRLGGESPALRYNLALALARTKDVEGAEAEYHRALALNPRFDEAWNNLALLLEQRGEVEAAMEALHRAVDLAQPSGRYRPSINLARMLVRAGRRPEAIDLLEEAIRLSPRELTPRLALAGVESQSPAGVERARELCRQVTALAPTDPIGHYHLGQLEERLGNRAEAEKEYRTALEIQPGHRRARYALASLCLDGGRSAEAARQYEVLLDQRRESRASFGLGRARRAAGDLAGASSAYLDAVALAGGRYPEALFNLGILHAEAGRPADAEAAYRQAVAQRPDYASAWINLSLLLSDLGRPDEALDAASEALAAEPRNEKAWFVKGRLLADRGRREEALAAYLEAARLRPGYTKSMLNAAVLHASAGRDEEAIRLYREVLEVDARNASAWYNLGLALGRADRDGEARAAYEKALEADPESTRAAQNLGVLYAREGRTADARRVFAEALEREPDNVSLRYNLALQLEKLGEMESAVRELRRVLSLDARHARAPGVMARILEAMGNTDEAARIKEKATVGKKRADVEDPQ